MTMIVQNTDASTKSWIAQGTTYPFSGGTYNACFGFKVSIWSSQNALFLEKEIRKGQELGGQVQIQDNIYNENNWINQSH